MCSATICPLVLCDGQCCPCPEHRTTSVISAALVSGTGDLALYADAEKTTAFGGTVQENQPVYVEGTGASSYPWTDHLLWRWVDGNSAVHYVTNRFTVLSVRLFGDVNLDGTVDAADKALHPALSHEYGWGMPAATNVFRPVRLRTDVGLSGGVYTLSLSGGTGAFRVWSDASGTNAPMLACGQTVTNGVNGVSFLAGADTDLYIEAVSNGTATLTYAYTGAAAGISCAASLKLTAWGLDIDVDSDNDGTTDTDDGGVDCYEEYAPGLILTVTNGLAEGAGLRYPVRLSTEFCGFTGTVRLAQSEGCGAVRIWTNTEPGTVCFSLPLTWNLSQDETPPANVWIDGVSTGAVWLSYSAVKDGQVLTSDSVRITVIPPASYAPGGGDFAAVCAPLCTMNNTNDENNLGWSDGTTLAPAHITSAWMPISFFPSPGSSANSGKGWGCVVLDTYLDDTVSAALVLQQLSGTDVSDIRWVQLGAGKRAIGFKYDKPNGRDIWLRLVPDRIRNAGTEGGRPLVKRDATSSSSYLDWSF